MCFYYFLLFFYILGFLWFHYHFFPYVIRLFYWYYSVCLCLYFVFIFIVVIGEKIMIINQCVSRVLRKVAVLTKGGRISDVGAVEGIVTIGNHPLALVCVLGSRQGAY